METSSVAGPGTALTGFELSSADCRPADARTRLAQYLDRHCHWVRKPAVLLVVSELITNAIRHTPGQWTMRVEVQPAQLTIEVSDQSPHLPAVRAPDLTGGTGGMGMHIITELTSWHETEILPAGAGKTIRAGWLAPQQAEPGQ